jgi:hypothetical protein
LNCKLPYGDDVAIEECTIPNCARSVGNIRLNVVFSNVTQSSGVPVEVELSSLYGLDTASTARMMRVGA